MTSSPEIPPIWKLLVMALILKPTSDLEAILVVAGFRLKVVPYVRQGGTKTVLSTLTINELILTFHRKSNQFG